MNDDRHGSANGYRSNGIATAALVFGVLALCGGLTAIPAIICGVIGVRRAGRRGGAGRGKARVGLALGVIMAIVAPAVLVPGIDRIHDNATRARSVNNVKQILLGAAAYNDEHNKFPTPYVRPPAGQSAPADPAGRLSWRVSLLPYIEQGSLYKQIRLDEAWDGPANGPLTNRRIPTYQDPARAGPEPDNQTPYRVFVGAGAFFDEAKPRRSFANVVDGNVILLVEAAQTVPWAQYNELPFTSDGPLPPLGAPHRDVFLVGMIDGSARWIKKSVSPEMLRAAITPDGGEPIAIDW
ncbi:DUF1559 domain-containing protein [Fimbriiglobus ruber]|uniref:DUF1559 domain-containing protein n=1 Tax=Fimbriiglobus ruber TaxID=1908690 RepID=A0A225D4A6_9BACT|nr:DUF1559 domain-containing protein [Fimbriiglobus ruber]OWK36332.1 hypothetical protein FRUB_08895 [Fimbriiglobus ruber]OWK42910.1 hypothetical protein FRUB_02507 [Fimbriiglobus ruber]